MYAFYHASSTPGLTQDDIEGICATNIPGGLRLTSNAGLFDAGATCNPMPTNGFQSACGDADASPPATGGDDGGGGDVTTVVNTGGCSVGASTTPPGIPGAGAVCLLGIGVVLRRIARWRQRRAATVLGWALAFACVAELGTRDARASTSVAVTFEELVASATGVAVVVPVDRFARRENGRVVSYVRARVVSLLAGSLPDEVSVRTLGGVADGIGEMSRAKPRFPRTSQNSCSSSRRVRRRDLYGRPPGPGAAFPSSRDPTRRCESLRVRIREIWSSPALNACSASPESSLTERHLGSPVPSSSNELSRTQRSLSLSLGAPAFEVSRPFPQALGPVTSE